MSGGLRLETLGELGLDTGSAERMDQYLQLLKRWSTTHNLVAFRNDRELVLRQVGEALPAVARMSAETPGHLVDIGSGGGFPGIPLLILRPQWQGVLLEPRQKRWAFLKTVVRELGLCAEVERLRYQEWRPVRAADLVAARAVGEWERLLQWAERHLAAGGEVALWLSMTEEARLRELGGWHVLSSPLMSLERGTVTFFRRCFT